MSDDWEAEIAGLLTELADVQGAVLDVLNEKRGLLAGGDHRALSALAGREDRLVERLQGCHDRRQQLLARAAADGLPSDSIRSLTQSLPDRCRGRMQETIRQAQQRSRFLQHQSLANWVLVQRSLLHLSQLIEIIATGGRMKPTYGDGSDRQNSGALVDRAI
jgi:hypothetical protein